MTKNLNPLDRARAAFQKAVSKAEAQSRQPATLGWRKAADNVQITVPGRANMLYITLTDKTVTTALNRAGVPRQAFLPVLIVMEHGQAVIVARDNRNAGVLAQVPDSAYGVPAHPLGQHSDTRFTEPYTDGYAVTWDGEEGAFVLAPAGALVTSVNGQTGAVVLDADDIDDTATTNKFATDAELTKLAGIAAGANLYVHPNHSGDVTSSGDGATTIADNAVSNAKAADMAQSTIKGRAAAAGTGDPTDLSAAQVAAIVQASIDHGSVAGLADDDHSQYHTDARGDARYPQLAADNVFTGGENVFVADGSTTDDNQLELRSARTFLNATDLLVGGIQVRSNDTNMTEPGIIVAAMQAIARASHTASVLDTAWRWMVTKGLTMAEAMRIEADGRLLIGVGSAGASVLGVKAGTSTNDAAVGGVLYVTSTQTGNVGSGEDTLASYSVPANTLSANNQSLWFEACGTFTANANSKTLRVRFGSSGTSLIISFAAVTAQEWIVRGRVIRTGAATQKGYATYISSGGPDIVTNIETGLNQTLSSAVTLAVTGEGVSNNDIVLQSLIVGWDDANT